MFRPDAAKLYYMELITLIATRARKSYLLDWYFYRPFLLSSSCAIPLTLAMYYIGWGAAEEPIYFSRVQEIKVFYIKGIRSFFLEKKLKCLFRREFGLTKLNTVWVLFEVKGIRETSFLSHLKSGSNFSHLKIFATGSHLINRVNSPILISPPHI